MTIIPYPARLLFVVASIFFQSHAFGQAPVSNDRLHAIVDAYHQLGLFNGKVFIAKNDRVIFQKSYGSADIATHHIEQDDGVKA